MTLSQSWEARQRLCLIWAGAQGEGSGQALGRWPLVAGVQPLCARWAGARTSGCGQALQGQRMQRMLERRLARTGLSRWVHCS